MWEPIYVNAVDNIYCAIFLIKFSITEKSYSFDFICFSWLQESFIRKLAKKYMKYLTELAIEPAKAQYVLI